MRALVISDSHGDNASVNMALTRHNSADMVIFLGDGERDIYTQENSRLIMNKTLVAVRGNCDWYSELPDEQTVTLGGKKIYCLHGHTLGVKHGFTMLEEKAELMGVNIAVHGHTHSPRVEYKNGIWYMCPGSIRSGEYGIIDIDEKSDTILCYTNCL